METNATSWTLPEGGVVVPEEGAETGGGEEAIDELMDNYPYLKKDVVAEAKPGEWLAIARYLLNMGYLGMLLATLYVCENMWR